MLLRLLRSSLANWTGRLEVLPCASHIWTGQHKRMADGEEKIPESSEKITDGISALKLKQIEDDVATSYILVDIGANLTNSKYSRDLDSVVERAKDAGQSSKFCIS